MTISDLVKIGTGLIGGLAASLGWMYLNFESVAASDQKWQDHIQANQCAKVSDYRILAERLKWELDNLELTPKEREAKERDLAIYQKEMDALDPNRRCKR